jgi:acetolactate synthase-1/2/3 large subunit
MSERTATVATVGRSAVLDVRVDADAKSPATWDLPPLPHPEPTFGWPERTTA